MSALIIIYRRASGVFGLIHTALQFLTGIFVPIVVMPPCLKIAALILPGTAGIDLVRYVLLSCGTIATPRIEVLLLMGETLILFYLSHRLIVIADKIGHKQGYI